MHSRAYLSHFALEWYSLLSGIPTFIYTVIVLGVQITCYGGVLYVLHTPNHNWNNHFHAAHSDTTVARILVGNKCDLENIRAVSVEEGKSLAESEGMFFMETSALDSTNVNKAFEIVIREIYNSVSRKVLNSDSYKAELSVNRVNLVNDGTDGSKQKQGYSCCSRWLMLCFLIPLKFYKNGSLNYFCWSYCLLIC